MVNNVYIRYFAQFTKLTVMVTVSLEIVECLFVFS
jgi:hypothetical protein